MFTTLQYIVIRTTLMRVYINILTFKYVIIYIHMYIRMYTCTHTYTHTHSWLRVVKPGKLGRCFLIIFSDTFFQFSRALASSKGMDSNELYSLLTGFPAIVNMPDGFSIMLLQQTHSAYVYMWQSHVENEGGVIEIQTAMLWL